MIRLPPSTLVLGESDLKDFTKRRNQTKAEVEFDLLERLAAISVHNGLSPNTQSQSGRQSELKLELQQRSSMRRMSIPGNIAIGISSRKPSVASVMESLESTPLLESVEYSDESSEAESTIDEHDCVSVRRFSAAAENESQPPQSSSPEKDGCFHYGGFTKSPSQDIIVRSSPFSPEEPSTPHHLHLQSIEPHSTRSRRPLPRSPLYLFQSTVLSPERRPTLALTPRVVSRVATHNSPGIIFSAPPRRPPRNSARFRHQTNSFSFDESESSSAAYEQQRVSFGSISETAPRLEEDLNPHEELRGSSSLSIRPAPVINLQDELPYTVTPRSRQRCRREFIFSSPRLTESDEEVEDDNHNHNHDGSSQTPSPQLPLPAPFSAAKRSSSNSEALHWGYLAPDPQASPVLIPSSSPAQEFHEALEHFGLPTSMSRQSGISETTRRADGTTPSSSRRVTTPAQLLSRLVSRVEASYKSRSPVYGRQSPLHLPGSASVSPTSRGAQFTQQDHSEIRRSYQVYNDGLAPDVQPQTPDHLPEARHRSRYHASWTAPGRRSSRRRLAWPMHNNDGAGSDMPERPIGNLLATPSRGGGGLDRYHSPTGLRSRGFQGLYGGRENADDEQSWVDGVRFDNAEVRLWGLRDSREEPDQRDLNDTPEREDWRSNLR